MLATAGWPERASLGVLVTREDGGPAVIGPAQVAVLDETSIEP